jgi:hypothetical protein
MVKHQTVSDGTFASATEYLKDHVASTTNSGIELIWKDASERALHLANQVAGVAWTDLDLTAFTSATAKIAVIQLRLTVNTVGAAVCSLGIRKNGTTPTYYPIMSADPYFPIAGNYIAEVCLIGMDTGQVIEYHVSMGAGWDVDCDIEVLAYYE